MDIQLLNGEEQYIRRDNMHDKMNNEESVEELVNNINEYFNIDALNIDDLSKNISECNVDKVE